MITAHIKFKCTMPMCKNTKSFYIMPLDEKVGNSYVHSLTNYRITCRICGQDYILSFKIKSLKRKNNGK